MQGAEEESGGAYGVVGDRGRIPKTTQQFLYFLITFSSFFEIFRKIFGMHNIFYPEAFK